MSTSTNADQGGAAYRALYGDTPCTAYPEGETRGRTFSVLLDVDSGFGLMVHTRIGRSQLTFTESSMQGGGES